MVGERIAAVVGPREALRATAPAVPRRPSVEATPTFVGDAE
jgi:hypothetical protein